MPGALPDGFILLWLSINPHYTHDRGSECKRLVASTVGILPLGTDWVIIREYVDRASGSRESRPEFDRMMNDLTKGHIDAQALLVWKIDRLGRSVRHLHNVIAELKEAGVAFVSWSDNIDLSTATGELVFGVLANVAQFELSLIRERTKAGLRDAVAEGKKLGRPCGKKPSRTTLWRRSKQLQK